MTCPVCRGCGETIDAQVCPLCHGLCQHGRPADECMECAGLQFPALAMGGRRRPYERPLVLGSVPARVNVAALLGALLGPHARPPGVPRCALLADELARLKELALAGAPCGACDDALCVLARSVLALQLPS